MDRRRFIARSTAAAGALGLVGLGGCARGEPRQRDILILGGTGFIGPHQVRAARERGHTLTLFNRGRTNPDLFPGIETLLGDRNGDLESLRGRRWDVVLDNSGFEPEQVRLSAGLLKDAVDHYVFVSTQSVYADRSVIGQDESGAVGRSGVPEQEWSGYGPLKALCEKELEAAMPGRSTVVRPAVIVGPGDSSDRFTYWVQRVDRGGDILAPGRPDDPTQFIDVRDLTEWMVRLAEEGTTGTFNATGPREVLTVQTMLETIDSVTDSTTNFVWTDYDFLAEQGVRPFSDLPMWMVPEGRTAGFMRMSAARAQAAGLTYRPLAVTAGDTLAWWKARPEEERAELSAGLTLEREAEILAAWRARVAVRVEPGPEGGVAEDQPAGGGDALGERTYRLRPRPRPR